MAYQEYTPPPDTTSGDVHQSLWQKILGALMPAPSGLQGLLAPDDVDQARRQGLLSLGMQMMASSAPRIGMRPTIGDILPPAIAAGQQGYQQGLMQPLQQRATGMQLQQQQQLQQLHTSLAQKYSGFSQLPPDQKLAALQAMAVDYANGGDPETAGKLADVIGKIKQSGAGRYQAVQAGDEIYTFDPTTGTYTPGPKRGLPADKLLEDAQNRQMRALALAQANSEFQERQATTLSKAFITRVKPITDKGAFLAQASAMLQQAASNPVAYTSALTNFVMAVDQKPQLRYQVLQYFAHEIDPSVAGRWDLFKDKIISGKYPPQILARMAQVLEAVRQTNQQEYNVQRAAEVKRHPVLDEWLPTADEFFQPLPTSSGTPNGVDLYKQYGITPPTQ